jgi:hypothetical protein
MNEKTQDVDGILTIRIYITAYVALFAVRSNIYSLLLVFRRGKVT